MRLLIISRLLAFAFTLLIASTVLFLAINVLPGSAAQAADPRDEARQTGR